jgi:NAD(P)-dependent dehydrogenase (short-subunit alcohol dehydrogenase family)
MTNRFDLTGRRALITGAGGLLGPEHGAALLECGAAVVLTDVTAELAERAADKLRGEFPDATVEAMALDVTAPNSVADAADQAGRIDILVNNAAIDPKVGGAETGKELTRLEAFPLSSWELEIAVGLTGAFLCAQTFGAAMAARGEGAILNVASDLSVIAPDQRLYRQPGLPEDQQPVKPVTYSVIKTGLIGLTRYLAGYWADKGVRCNAISPGGVRTQQPEEFVQRLSALIPMGRMAARDEYRAAVQFLCSDASRYVTGQNLVVDGGRSVL